MEKGSMLKNFFAKIDKWQWVLVILIGILAFAIRGHLIRYELFFEFDPYLHTRIIEYILQTGVVPATDPSAYYFMKVSMPVTYVFWYTSAIFYKIFFLGAGYVKVNVILLAKFMPAIYGAIVAVISYFIGKEIYNKKAGYAMAFIAAVTPAFVYRTMAGFFEEDCFGFIWFVLGILFMIRALKSRKLDKPLIINTVLSGIAFGLMVWSWGMFLLVPLVVLPFMLLALLRIPWIKEKKEMIAFFAVFIGIFALFTFSNLFMVIVGADPFGWIVAAQSYASQALGAFFIPVVLAAIALIVINFYLAYSSKGDNEKTRQYSKFMALLLVIILVGTLLLTAFLFMTKQRAFEVTGVLGASVGEENTGHQFFGSKYGILIMLPVLALILIPLRLWRKKDDYFSLIMFVWILVTLVMAWYKLKFTFVFGLSIAPAAAVVVAEILEYLKDKSRIEHAIALGCVAFLLIAGLAAGIVFVKTNIPNIELSSPTWKPALYWMEKNLPDESKMFNWWDEGHWVAFMGEQKVLNDNRNLDKQSDADFALFTITNDLNTALGLVRKYDSDYLVLSADNFQKMPSMASYAFDVTDMGDPKIMPYRLPAVYIPCSVSADSTVNCGGNPFQLVQWQNVPSNWTTESNDLYQERVPLFVYRDSDEYNLYALNPTANSTVMAKLWFKEPEASRYFELLYSKEGVKIFKINKAEIAKVIN